VHRPLRQGAREVSRVARAVTPTHAHLRARLVAMALATIVLDAVASVFIFFFERNADRTEITNIGDAIFWTSTQLLTVSSQLPNPISTPARVLDIGLQAWAISVVAVLAGSFASFFHRRSNEMDPP
jgi:quinol-cytochrome oxidoreductase complex cytochrome b subunit